MRQIVQLRADGRFALDLRYFRHHTDAVRYEWRGGAPEVGTLYTAAFAELLGPARGADEPLTDRHRDIARSVQAMFEEAAFHLMSRLHRRYGTDAIAISGGCGFNSVANGRIYQRTPFRRCFVQAAAGDAGGAIGAAYVVAREVGEGDGRRFVMDHAFWGPGLRRRRDRRGARGTRARHPGGRL